MSANDFKAQATNQSIVATSIQSAEAFGSTQSINTRMYLRLTPIASSQSFPSILKNTLTLVNYLYPAAIGSSEFLSRNDIFNSVTSLTPTEIFSSYSINSASLSLHSYISPDGVAGIGTFTDPTFNTITDINFNAIGSIGSSEIFGYLPTFTNTQIVELLPINSIQSREALGVLSEFQSNSVIYQYRITSAESLSRFNVFGRIAVRNVTPNTIISRERFGTRIQFRPTIEGISRASYIGSYVTLANNILVEIQKIHFLDVDTIVDYPLYNQLKPNYLVFGFTETTDYINADVQIIHTIETEITQEKISIAREKPLYLESYIVASQFVDTFVYNEQNNKYYRTKYTYNEK